jgi:hypothetical protein
LPGVSGSLSMTTWVSVSTTATVPCALCSTNA